jgi:hypothetical protein
MPNCPDDNMSGRWARSRRQLLAADSDEEGAVLLMCLAAILILLLMGWLVMDGIFLTHDKAEIQASADSAAFSQASVKARSMNMMAFSNIGKRTIFGTHAVYESMFEAYAEWVEQLERECEIDPDNCDRELYERNDELLQREFNNDYMTYLSNQGYYLGDLRALDYYQMYLRAITPWWGWNEAVLRAQRNGATLATSFPPPRGVPRNSHASLINPVVAQAGGSVGWNVVTQIDRLPVDRDEEFWEDVIDGDLALGSTWEWEHQMNVELHRERSERGARRSEVIENGATHLMTHGLRNTFLALGTYGSPWRIDDFDTQADWMFATSNLVLTYHNQPAYFDALRDNYAIPGEDYVEADDQGLDARLYRPGGYWGMARSEISFQADQAPDLWLPAWTARMRPVALPREYRERGVDFNGIYHLVLDHLVLSGWMHGEFSRGEIANPSGEFFDDLVYFERVSRAMGQSTIEGVAR